MLFAWIEKHMMEVLASALRLDEGPVIASKSNQKDLHSGVNIRKHLFKTEFPTSVCHTHCKDFCNSDI